MKSTVIFYAAALAAIGTLSACAGDTKVAPAPNVAGAHSGPVSLIPIRPLGANLSGGMPRTASPSETRGIYVSSFSGSAVIDGYRENPRRHPQPFCTVQGANDSNGIAVDGKGDLLVPAGGSQQLLLFKGPKMCGLLDGSIADPYGQPSDAASSDARDGPIAIANVFDTDAAGSIAVCTRKGGCTANLTNAGMYEVGGIAMAADGDCWASATNSGGTATLTYFKGCSGAGEATTGFLNAYYGGLDIDSHGNLVSVSAFDASIYVYKGCNPVCTLVGGPYAMRGGSFFARLNRAGTKLVAGDFENDVVDMYAYAPSGLRYLYSFGSNGGSNVLEGVAYNPRSKE